MLVGAIGTNPCDFNGLSFGFEAYGIGPPMNSSLYQRIVEFGCNTALAADEKLALSRVTGVHTAYKSIE